MASNAAAVWRVRPSGNNNNGGGFDCTISSAASGTNGVFTGGGATFTDTVAAAFTSGMAGSSLQIYGIGFTTHIGQFLISAFVSSTQITLANVGPGINIAGPVSWHVGSGQDYSQQNAAQLTQSGGTVSTSTVTLTDTGASFTSALIGNAIRVAGTGITTTFTFITAVPSSTTLTLQTSPGTTGTSVTYNIGGAWADFWTNPNASNTPVVDNNVVYILGSGTPNPSSYTYDYTASTGLLPNSGLFPIRLWGDPGLTGFKAYPDTTGAMPVIKFNVASTLLNNNGGSIEVQGLWIVGTTTAAGKYVTSDSNAGAYIFGCVLDQFSFDMGMVTGIMMISVGCEVFSSVAGSAGTSAAFFDGNQFVTGCNIHDHIGYGIQITNGSYHWAVINTIIAKGLTDGINNQNFGHALIQNNTIDGNAGHGINSANLPSLRCTIINNIISNHTTAGKLGLETNNTYGANVLIDYNTYYNNTANYDNQAGVGPHDTALVVTPYVGQATQNYTLA